MIIQFIFMGYIRYQIEYIRIHGLICFNSARDVTLHYIQFQFYCSCYILLFVN